MITRYSVIIYLHVNKHVNSGRKVCPHCGLCQFLNSRSCPWRESRGQDAKKLCSRRNGFFPRPLHRRNVNVRYRGISGARLRRFRNLFSIFLPRLNDAAVAAPRPRRGNHFLSGSTGINITAKERERASEVCRLHRNLSIVTIVFITR